MDEGLGPRTDQEPGTKSQGLAHDTNPKKALAGDVTFDHVKPTIDRAADGKSVANATFSAPGEYILRVERDDDNGSGGGGFQCCWSNAHVRVTVK